MPMMTRGVVGGGPAGLEAARVLAIWLKTGLLVMAAKKAGTGDMWY